MLCDLPTRDLYYIAFVRCYVNIVYWITVENTYFLVMTLVQFTNYLYYMYMQLYYNIILYISCYTYYFARRTHTNVTMCKFLFQMQFLPWLLIFGSIIISDAERKCIINASLYTVWLLLNKALLYIRANIMWNRLKYYDKFLISIQYLILMCLTIVRWSSVQILLSLNFWMVLLVRLIYVYLISIFPTYFHSWTHLYIF